VEQASADIAAGLDAARAAVDWHDFVVVETIEYTEEELREEEMQVDEGGPGSTVGDEWAAGRVENGGDGGFVLEGEERLNIRTNYVPPSSLVSGAQSTTGVGASQAPQLTFLHPVTGQQVPLDRATEHLRVELIDPKWRAEQQKAAQKFSHTNVVSDELLAENLKKLVGGGASAPKKGRF